MKLLNRIKKAYSVLTDPKEIEPSINVGLNGNNQVLGDGKAELLPDMTEEEYEDYIRNEESGWGKFKQRFKLK